MTKYIARIVLLALAWLIVGCEAAPTAVPPPPTRPLRTLAPTATNPPAAPPTLLPTVAPATETPTVAPTATASPTPFPTNTAIPPTLPRGLFVTGLRIQPDPAPRGEDLVFYPTFLNTTGIAQNYRWIVYIFKSDNRTKSLSETTRTDTALPSGTSEQKSLGSWKLGVGGPCEDFVARVGFFDQENKSVNFTKPDGTLFEKDFKVCPASELPPRPTAIPSITPFPGPGLYVTDIRTDPVSPIRGVDLTFYVSFVNTTGSLQNLKWIVYIYRPENMARSFGETTGATTTFPSTIGEAQSAGTWKLPLGGPCENFTVRAAWFDKDNKPVFFNTFDGKPFEKGLTVCPP